MCILGNLFTHYNYTKTDISFAESKHKISVQSNLSNINIKVNTSAINHDLPENSPFLNWKEARRFAGPLPFTFTYNKKTKSVLIIEGVRKNWKPQPVSVINATVGFLKTRFNNAILANAFVLKEVPYYWKKGKIETWT